MKAMQVVGACFEAVAVLKPERWLVENPRGRLRWFIGTPKQTIRYSDYDMKYRWKKQTDFWGNLPFPMVQQNHEFKNYRKMIDCSGATSAERAKIPLGVSQAVLQGVEGGGNTES